MGGNKDKYSRKFKEIFGMDKNSYDRKNVSNNTDKNDIENTQNKKSLAKSIGPSNIVILLMVGVLLLILSWPSGSKDAANKKTANEIESINASSKDEASVTKNQSQTGIYTYKLEERLEEILRKVEGIGDVEVMITLQGSKELVILKDQPFTEERINESDGEGGKRISYNHSYEENTIMVENEDGSKTPYVLKEIEPQVEGIVVIASGGNNAPIINQIIEAAQVLFGVPAHKVKVMKMN